MTSETRDKLPSDEVMKIMASLAMEQAAEFYARMAERYATSLPNLSGEDALLAFAAAIRSTRAKLNPPGSPSN